MPTTTTVTVGGSSMDILIEAPARKSPGPAILLMYHRGGFDKFTHSLLVRLSAAGYVVATPDVSHRTSRDIRMEDRKQYFKDSEVVADMAATLEILKARHDVDKDRLIILGHCMGGRMTLLGAGRLNAFRAAVVFYGGGCHVSWGKEAQTPLDTLGGIRCPVIGFFGDKDTNPSPEQVNVIDAELTKHGVVHTFHRYPDVGHGFQNPDHGLPPAEMAATDDSWAKTFRFLESVGLAPAPVA